MGIGLRFGIGPLRVYIPLLPRRRRRRRRGRASVTRRVVRRVDARSPVRDGRQRTGRWYFVVAVVSGGVLAWLPFWHAMRQLGGSALRRLVWVYGVVGVVLLALVGATPTDASGNAVGVAGHVLQVIFGCLAVPTIGLACVQLAPLRRQVYGLAGPVRPVQQTLQDEAPEATAVDPAVAAVLAARDRRAQARELVATDPLMARELRIGRPDLGHRYNDGGLVDLNSAPAVVIARMCDVDVETAGRIVDARDRQGGVFSNADEVFVVADIPWASWERIRDRAIVLG